MNNNVKLTGPSTPHRRTANAVYSKSPAMNTEKFYAVRQGHSVGIYHDYSDVKALIKGASNSCHQQFQTKEQAHNFLTGAICPRSGCRGKDCPPAIFHSEFNQGYTRSSEQFNDDTVWDVNELDQALRAAAIKTTPSQAQSQNSSIPITTGNVDGCAVPPLTHAHPGLPTSSPTAFTQLHPLATSSPLAAASHNSLAATTVSLGVPLHTYLRVHHELLLDHIQFSFDTAYNVIPVLEFTDTLVRCGLSRPEGQLVLLLFNCQ
ncbi:hypothetical protein FRC03_005029 [Tulasnella sp. 419]|nr:hypothetical protein FRC03_005029 [Tulasnella sp. 419]